MDSGVLLFIKPKRNLITKHLKFEFKKWSLKILIKKHYFYNQNDFLRI